MRLSQWILSLLLLGGLAAQPARAQQTAGGLTPLRGILGAQAGDYRFFEYDKGLLQKTYVDEVFKKSREDRDYFLSSIHDIESEFRSVLRTAVFNDGGLKSLSDKGRAAGTFTPAIDFLKAVNRFQEARIALENKIETLTAMGQGALPSQIQLAADGSGLDKAVNYGNIDFEPLKQFYLSRAAEITKFLANLPQYLILANGVQHLTAENSGNGLTLENVGPLLTPAKIQEMRAKILAARRWDVDATDALDSYTTYTRKLVQNFIATYGTTEKWRHLATSEREARARDAKQIVEAFWTRSYLRAAYGMPIGAIGIHYDKKWFHLDIVTNSTKSLGAFYEEVVWDQNEMLRISQNYRNAIRRANDRAAKILDGELSFVASAANLVTYLNGNRNLAESLQMVLTLLSADLYEERLVLNADGLAQMKARFRSRYAATETDSKFYRALQAVYDPQNEDEGAGAAIGLNQDSLNGRFQTVLTFVQTKETELQVAESLRQTLVAVEGTNHFSTTRKKRINDLFNESNAK